MQRVRHCYLTNKRVTVSKLTVCRTHCDRITFLPISLKIIEKITKVVFTPTKIPSENPIEIWSFPVRHKVANNWHPRIAQI